MDKIKLNKKSDKDHITFSYCGTTGLMLEWKYVNIPPEVIVHTLFIPQDDIRTFIKLLGVKSTLSLLTDKNV